MHHSNVYYFWLSHVLIFHTIINIINIIILILIFSAPTIDPTIAQSSTISIQMDTNMPSSSSRRKHETVTEIVSSCSVSADVPVEGAVSGNTTAAGLAGAVVPLLIIIMILVTVLIVLLVLIYRKRRNHSRCCIIAYLLS